MQWTPDFKKAFGPKHFTKINKLTLKMQKKNNLNTKTGNKRNKKKQNKSAVFRPFHMYSVTQPIKRFDDALQLPYTPFSRRL